VALEDLPVFTRTAPKQGFMTPNSLETTRKKMEGGGRERGEKKKRTSGSHNFYIV